MTLDQRILKAEAELKIAWRNGDDQRAAELSLEVERLMDQRDRAADHVHA